MHNQNAQLFAKPLDRHAKERGINLFAGFGHVAEAAGGGGIGGVHHLAGAGHPAHQPFAKPHPGLVHGLFLETLGRAKLQRLLVAEEIDGADLGAHGIGGQMGDLVEARLPGGILGHGVAQPPQQLAAFTLETVGHGALAPSCSSYQL